MNFKAVFIFIMAVASVFADESISEIDKEIQMIECELGQLSRSKDRVNQQDKNSDEYIKVIRSDLGSFSDLDQRARKLQIKVQDEKYTDRIGLLVNVVDKTSSIYLKSLLEHESWITITRFGEEADRDAWLLAQHADLKLQKLVLEKLSSLWIVGETKPEHFAYLHDRVAMQEKRPQKYGTQFCLDASGILEVYEIEDVDELKELRTSMNLQPFEQYIDIVLKTYLK